MESSYRVRQEALQMMDSGMGYLTVLSQLTAQYGSVLAGSGVWCALAEMVNDPEPIFYGNSLQSVTDEDIERNLEAIRAVIDTSED